MKGNSKEGKQATSTGPDGDDATGSSKKAKKVTYEKQLEEINKELRSKSTGGSAQGKAGTTKKQKLKPEQEVVLLEQKCILLLKLKRHKEVVDDGYSIIGRLGPNVVVYKCILIALVRLGKPEEDIIELLDAWRKATPKCTQMLETKRKFDGYLVALRSGMKHNDIFSGIEETLGLNADGVLSKQLSNTEESKESKWVFRAPPPRHTTFSMCPRAASGSSCIYGEECLFAHSQEELREWKLRADNADPKKSVFLDEMSEDSANRLGKKRPIPMIYRSLLIPPLCIHYLLDLGKKIKEASNIHEVLVDEIPSVKIKIGTPLKYQKRLDGISPVQCIWSFMVASKMPMGTVSILHDANRESFSITNAVYYNKKKESIGLIELHPNNKVQTKLQVLNTFIQPSLFLRFNAGWPDMCYYKVDVAFESRDPFPEPGLYRQSIVFDFKKDPKVVKHISVEVLPKMEPIGTHLENVSIKSPWANVAPPPVEDSEMNRNTAFEHVDSSTCAPSLPESYYSDKVCDLPYKAVGFKHLTVIDSESGQGVKLNSVLPSGSCDSDASKEDNLFLEDALLAKENYRSWWYDFIEVEQKARHKAVKQVKTLVEVTLSNTYSPTSECSHKYSCTGELYGKIEMISQVSLDPKLDNLITNHCTSVIIHTSTDNVTVSFRQTTPRYLCRIVEKSKSSIFIAIGKIAVSELMLLPDSIRQLHVQFVLDSYGMDKLKATLDGLSKQHLKLLFPSFESSKLPYLKVLGSATSLNEEELFLNNRQQSVYNIITGKSELDTELFIPPLLLTGGVSTGKSHVLAYSLRGLLRSNTNAYRILICTRTDTAADIFITEYMHTWLINDQLSVQRSKPLRVYDTDRFVDSVGGIVKHYCLFNYDGAHFRYPTREEVLSHRVIIVTVSSCASLLRLELDSDTFSHIMIDEADQCLEVETIQPIVLAGRLTRVVVAGDVAVTQSHIFTPPTEVTPLSLLERLRNMYPFRHPFVVNLIENYSNHEVILKFVSRTFYHDQLRPASNQPCHPSYYPVGLRHISTSKEIQAENGGGFYNMDEIHCIVDFIDDLLRSWPGTWGKPKDKDSLIVVTPYINHIMGLRVQLQLKGLQWINVDLASNLISKRFRVVIISTVRTRKFNLKGDSEIPEDMNHGFFSNRWLVNLAISSAKSLVMVFGDLCGLLQHGNCRDIWHKFAKECQSRKSLHGFTAQEGLQVEDPGKGCQSPSRHETPTLQPTEPKYNPRGILTPGLSSRSSNQNQSLMNDVISSGHSPMISAAASSLSSLSSSQTKTSEEGESASPWNSSTLANAPKTDLFSAFSADVKPLYSSSSSPLHELQQESKNGVESPDISFSNELSIKNKTIIKPSSISALLSPSLEASYKELKNETVINAAKQPSALLNTTSSTPLKSMMNMYSSPFDLTLLRQGSSSLETFGGTASSQHLKDESVKKLSDINLIEAQQMPLPIPTIPSQVLFDTKLVIGANRSMRMPNTSRSFESSETMGMAQSPGLSPQKFISPLTRAPPGFAQLPYEAKVGGFSSPENMASYHSSPSRSYGTNGKPTYKRNTYELPPRMLKNLQLTAGNISPTRKKAIPKHTPAAEMNFFEELGLDSQHDDCRSDSSSSSSESSFMDPDETISIVEDDNSSLSPQSDWIEVKSTRKGKNQHVKKKSKDKRAARHEEGNGDGQPPEMCVDDKIELITQMGFSKIEAVKALQSCEKDLQRAVDWLISKPPKLGS